jgi:hypothetical protein
LRHLILNSEAFTFDLPEVEPAVVTHKIEDRIEHFLDKLSVVADRGKTKNGDALAVLVIHFRYRDIEPALEPPNKAFNDAPFALKRGYTQQR